MGVKGLWKLVEPVAEKTTVEELAVKHIQNGGEGTFTIGVNASILIRRAITPPHHSPFYRQSDNAALKHMFKCIYNLCRCAVTLVFVFDGPDLPTKRGNLVNSPQYLDEKIAQLGSIFGIACHTAPAEAEAELALMSRRGVIDAVMTEDSDALTFGATQVLRIPSFKGNKFTFPVHVDCFKASTILSHEDIQLSRGGLVLLSVMVGGVYADGVPGCGIQTALELARAGYGSRLLGAAIMADDNERKKYRQIFRRNIIRELQRNPNGSLRRCHRALAGKLPPHFPDMNVVAAYALPSVSIATTFPERYMRDSINIGILASFCENHFSFGTSDGILDIFRAKIWPALATDEVMQVLQTRDDKPVPLEFSRSRALPEKAFQEYRVKFDFTMSAAITASSIFGLRQPSSQQGRCSRAEPRNHTTDVKAFWIPVPIYNRAFSIAAEEDDSSSE